jgi:hypothetical protein
MFAYQKRRLPFSCVTCLTILLGIIAFPCQANDKDVVQSFLEAAKTRSERTATARISWKQTSLQAAGILNNLNSSSAGA